MNKSKSQEVRSYAKFGASLQVQWFEKIVAQGITKTLDKEKAKSKMVDLNSNMHTLF